MTPDIYPKASSDASFQFEIFPAKTTDPLVGVLVRPDDDCPCGEGVAVINAGTPPHAGALVCIACHKHRGWLPNRVRDFISETINQLGRSSEPIAYRRGLSSTEGHYKMKQFDNRGSLFSVKQNKKAETDPDFTGTVNVNGVEYSLRGWTRTAKTSGNKFISLSVRPKSAKPDKAPSEDAFVF